MKAAIFTRSLILGSLIFVGSSNALADNMCRDVFDFNFAIKINNPILGQPLRPEVETWIQSLALTPESKIKLKNFLILDPNQAETLSNPTYRQFAIEVSKPSTDLSAVSDLINSLWSRGEDVSLASVIRQEVKDILAEMHVGAATPAKGKFKINWRAQLAQLKAMPKTFAKVRSIIKSDFNPSELDARVFDFYGLLKLKFANSQIRPWDTRGGYEGIKLSDIKDVEPTTWSRVAMMASEIEKPIDAYSDNSGEVLRVVSPQASRFMGKTEEESIAHRKLIDEAKKNGKNESPFCTNSWCIEENRHENALERMSENIVGWSLPMSVEFAAYPNLNPLKINDAFFHLVSRNSTEWNAGSAYIYMSAHAEGHLAEWIKQVRKDEEKHMAIFGGLYKYLKGDTYQQRLVGMLKKALHEAKEKNNGSDYGSVLNTEPVSALEMLYTHVYYEIKIREYFKSIPLKSLRKIFETDISLKDLPRVPMDPAKEMAIQQMSEQERIYRTSLARWPKKAREKALRQEEFEITNNEQIVNLVNKRFKGFKGAEIVGSSATQETLNQIHKLTAAEVSMTSGDLIILKDSLRDSLRDYQIMNNQFVRGNGMSVYLVSAKSGFDIVRDEAFAKVKKVEPDSLPVTATIPLPVASASKAETVFNSKVLDSQRLTEDYVMITLEKPQSLKLEAGMAAEVTMRVGNEVHTRVLSVANSHSSSEIQFAVNVSSKSEFKQAFDKIRPGENVQFKIVPTQMAFSPDHPAVMIAGGIGITPFRSMIQHWMQTGSKTPISLVYGGRSDLPFKSEFSRMQNDSQNKLDLTYTLSRPKAEWTGRSGRIDIDLLAEKVNSQPSDAIYYVAGSPEMVREIGQHLIALGIRGEQIRSEFYAPKKEEEQKEEEKICRCRAVTKIQIVQAIELGAKDIAGVSRATNACTGCGQCKGPVQQIISQVCGKK